VNSLASGELSRPICGIATTSISSNPAHLQIGNDGWAEFAFGAVNAAAELEDGYSTVLFRGSGFDEGDEISGIGSVEPQDDGSIEIAPITSRFAQECPIISARLAKPRPTETQAYR
jgi:hypothetical protein